MSLGCPREQFNTEYYNLLTGLEQSFFKEEVDQRDLMQLILSIAKLVEYFDLKKDPIKDYFLEKMQFILSRPFTICNLKKKEEESKHQEMRKSQHSHFSQNVQKLEMQSQLQSNSEENEETIKLLQEDYEQQLKDQTLLVQIDLNNQMGKFKNKLLHRKNKSLFSPCRANVEEEKIKRQNRLKTYQSSNSQNPYKEHIYLDDAFSFETLQNQ
ncbi:unnamed protein product (macronuclear) [Paramecium tetraurelia]|uniref:Uncharacterized protein n=1 Tax=Paramecium tetraurelia TaxID=5888 RepID=A0CJF5_PARTE|nr:uncharacterized protein GSPATT00000633001 [Paramecium tetraurelia]CAK70922.1 unnamed protein product [Paramecium tetraurelia]|eukprot:XP_001438319.1 hypothetical protein (macronuclear) [Paramecium tetraurelia strain d4-2]